MAIGWDIRGYGAGAIVTAYCSVCKGTFEIEHPTPTVHIRHCGNTRNSIPERIYERWWIAREGKKREGSGFSVRYL
jgi:hypothetical protein